jgi:chromosome segregation ATPase
MQESIETLQRSIERDKKEAQKEREELVASLQEREVELEKMQQALAEEKKVHEEKIKTLRAEIEVYRNDMQISEKNYRELLASQKIRDEEISIEISGYQSEIESLTEKIQTLGKEYEKKSSAFMRLQQEKSRITIDSEREREALKTKLATEKGVFLAEMETLKKQLIELEDQIQTERLQRISLEEENSTLRTEMSRLSDAQRERELAAESKLKKLKTQLALMRQELASKEKLLQARKGEEHTEISLEIKRLYSKGMSKKKIAKRLELPMSRVSEVLEKKI